MAESDLYLPIKSFLQQQGFDVKGEVSSCDIVAKRGDEALVIVEMKQSMSLQLLYQAVDRLTISDIVYIAIARPKKNMPREAVKLCRRLGLGLLVVAASGSVDVLAEPGPYAPRPSKTRQHKVLKEFNKRQGDPNLGGITRTKIMTAYKQDALRCLQHMQFSGPIKLSVLRKATGVDRAAAILRDNHYGWFARTPLRGIYELTPSGRLAHVEFQTQISTLQEAA